MTFSSVPTSSPTPSARRPSRASATRSRTSSASAPPASYGWHVAEFIESFCRPTQGEWAGRQLQLHPWQRSLLTDLFEVDPATGQRRYRTAYIGVPRKNGKSTLGAALAIYGLLMDGEPGAQVFSVAGDRAQASVVFHEARAMVEADPFLSERIRTFRYHLEVPETHSVYRVLSSDSKRQQGLNPSFVVFDEVHVQPNSELWSAMTLGAGTRRQPMVLGITTAGFDRQSLAFRLYEYGKRVLSGEVTDPTFFFRWWEPADPDCAIDDREAWDQANPSLYLSLKPEALASDVLSTPEHEFRRYHLNQWTTTANAWLPHGSWDKCAKPDRVVTPDEPVVLGFDGAWTNDSTALVGCTVNDPHLFVIRLWEKRTDVASWVVPSGEVEDELEAALTRYSVTEVACDPAYWREQIARWKDRGWPVVDFPNTLPRMVPACREFYTAVAEQRLTHDGSPALARHIANAVVKEDHAGSRIIKVARGQKIDLAIASVMAFDRANSHRAQPAVQFISFGDA